MYTHTRFTSSKCTNNTQNVSLSKVIIIIIHLDTILCLQRMIFIIITMLFQCTEESFGYNLRSFLSNSLAHSLYLVVSLVFSREAINCKQFTKNKKIISSLFRIRENIAVVVFYAFQRK